MAIAALVGLGLVTLAAVAPSARANTPCFEALRPGPVHTVARIIDGETVALDDGSELRLIGALAPRAIDVGFAPGEWVVEGRTRDALRDLVLGKSIEIRPGGDRRDRYGRRLGHAFVIDGGERHWVQGRLLRDGLARAYASADEPCAEALLAAEHLAREGGRGLWAEAAYQVRSAQPSGHLLGYRATFQLVEGQVVRVAVVRGTIYLNFGRARRNALTATMRRDERSMLGEFAGDPKGLEGRHVRVRGWIEERRGSPLINLSSGGRIEVLANPAPAVRR